MIHHLRARPVCERHLRTLLPTCRRCHRAAQLLPTNLLRILGEMPTDITASLAAATDNSAETARAIAAAARDVGSKAAVQVGWCLCPLRRLPIRKRRRPVVSAPSHAPRFPARHAQELVTGLVSAAPARRRLAARVAAEVSILGPSGGAALRCFVLLAASLSGAGAARRLGVRNMGEQPAGERGTARVRRVWGNQQMMSCSSTFHLTLSLSPNSPCPLPFFL